MQPYFDVLHNIERSVSERSSPDSIITAAQMVSDIAHAHDLDPFIYRTCVNILAQALIYGEDYTLDTLQFVLVHFQALCNVSCASGCILFETEPHGVLWVDSMPRRETATLVILSQKRCHT